MFATSNHDLPYPSGTDLVIEGDDALEALAERLDTILNAGPSAAGVVISRADSGSGSSTTAVLDFPGARPKMTDFTYDAGALIYTGPARTFVVDVEVTIEHPTGGAAVSSTVEVRVNGSSVRGSHDSIGLSSGTLGARAVTHTISVPVRLETGTGLDVTTAASPSANLGVCGLSIYPIGPAE